jgi:hypothetical protein
MLATVHAAYRHEARGYAAPEHFLGGVPPPATGCASCSPHPLRGWLVLDASQFLPRIPRVRNDCYFWDTALDATFS